VSQDHHISVILHVDFHGEKSVVVIDEVDKVPRTFFSCFSQEGLFDDLPAGKTDAVLFDFIID